MDFIRADGVDGDAGGQSAIDAAGEAEQDAREIIFLDVVAEA